MNLAKHFQSNRRYLYFQHWTELNIVTKHIFDIPVFFSGTHEDDFCLESGVREGGRGQTPLKRTGLGGLHIFNMLLNWMWMSQNYSISKWLATVLQPHARRGRKLQQSARAQGKTSVFFNTWQQKATLAKNFLAFPPVKFREILQTSNRYLL